MSSETTKTQIIRAFDAAAATYDSASHVQRDIARELVFRAAGGLAEAPKRILDLGCGAGHVTENALQQWPQAELTALDAAPKMLAALKSKYPRVNTLCADASGLGDIGAYDLILSSMMLHWLPDPRGALAQWRKSLSPRGKMHVALPVAGSLAEWRDACRAANLSDGLWPLPPPDFCAGLHESADNKAFVATYKDAKAFLQSFKQTGARKARLGHRPQSPAALRRLLATRQEPFSVTFQIEFLTLGATPIPSP